MITILSAACGCGLGVAVAVLAFDRAGHFHTGTWPHAIFAGIGALGVCAGIALFFCGFIYALAKALDE